MIGDYISVAKDGWLGRLALTKDWCTDGRYSSLSLTHWQSRILVYQSRFTDYGAAVYTSSVSALLGSEEEDGMKSIC
jgi:hypothetical protein